MAVTAALCATTLALLAGANRARTDSRAAVRPG
jgi:hypothetical protein